MTAAPPTATGGPPPTMPMDDTPPPTISVEDVPTMEGGPPAMIPVDVEPPPTTMPVKEISHIVKKNTIWRCMGTPQSFSAMFSKGDNCCDFLFVYLDDEVFPK